MRRFGSLRGYYSPQNNFRVKYDLTFKIRYPNSLVIHVHIASMVWAHLVASEATTTSKQPQRPNLTSGLKSVTSNIYVIRVSWYMTFLPGDYDKHSPLACVASQVKIATAQCTPSYNGTNVKNLNSLTHKK